MFKVLLFALALLATSCVCATTYQAAGFTGGYEDARLDETTYLVSFRGNGYTSRERVETLLLYRCAELTQQAGLDYFVLISDESIANESEVQTPGHYTSRTTGSASAYGNTAHGSSTTRGTYRPGQTIHYTKYKSTARMRVFKGEKPPLDANAYTAAEVIKYLGPKISGQ